MTRFDIHHYPSIGSTSDEARRLAAEGAPHGTVVQADEQTAGRGRRQHTWFSPVGNLYLSVVLRHGLPASRTTELGFVASLSVAETVQQFVLRDNNVRLKWPNDVLVNHGKIAGILVEYADGVTIIGMGLNVSVSPSGLYYKTTTILANGGVPSIDEVRDVLLDRLSHGLGLWEQRGFQAIRAAWLTHSLPVGTIMQVHINSDMITGAFAGLDSDGALLLKTDAGVQRVVAGVIASSL